MLRPHEGAISIKHEPQMNILRMASPTNPTLLTHVFPKEKCCSGAWAHEVRVQMRFQGAQVRSHVRFQKVQVSWAGPLSIDINQSFFCFKLCQRMDVIEIFRQRVNLGYYGAPTLKPVHLYCNYRWINEIVIHACRSYCPMSEGVTTVITAAQM